MNPTYKAVALKRSAHEDLKAFQALACGYAGRMVTQSEALSLAVELATKHIRENKSPSCES